MKKLVGLWQTYRPGEICSVLAELIRKVTKDRKRLTSGLFGKETIQSVEELNKILKQYEKQMGVRRLLDLLGQGLELEGEPGGLRIRTFLRLPDGTEDRSTLFKDLISDSILRESTNFTERYFMKQSNVIFQNRLERCLKKKLWFSI